MRESRLAAMQINWNRIEEKIRATKARFKTAADSQEYAFWRCARPGPLAVVAFCFCWMVAAPPTAAQVSNPARKFDDTGFPPRLKRAESFFGIHFDFHAGPDCTEIGKNTTREMIEDFIKQVGPDYVQIDCKGHRGMSSYPTRVGNPAPGFVSDPLLLWRQVTAEQGVALYMHYSGVADEEAIIKHPAWAVISGGGKLNKRATSLFGPYADSLMIPQLRELAGDYGVDGAWVDGDCWSAQPDWSEPARKAFREATGVEAMPRRQGDPHWMEFLEFNRDAFRRYLHHYITEVKKTNPGFQVCSNWAFVDHMPEAVSAPVDFLSGDLKPDDSVNSARFSARYMARQGKPWDLMPWSFSLKAAPPEKFRDKTAIQLQREAAVVLAMGGGVEVYFRQTRDGAIREAKDRVPVMADVSRFCRARQELCHHAEPIPQIGLLYSTADHYRRIKGLFRRDLAPINGTLQALLEGQHSVEVLGEHQLAGRMNDYPLIIVPECKYLETSFKDDLRGYVKAGGNLLLIGPETAAMFEAELKVMSNAGPDAESRFLSYAGKVLPIEGLTKAVRLGPGVQPFGRIRATKHAGSGQAPAASITSSGRGRIAATYFNFSEGYLKAENELARRFLSDLVRELFPRPLVEVKGSPHVDVSVIRKGGKLLVNLVNTAGPHREAGVLTRIPPVGPLTVIIRQDSRPAGVVLEPSGKPLAFDFTDGKVRVTVPNVSIHEVIVIS